MRIKDKIKKPRRPVVVYEILPPREIDVNLNSYAGSISSLLSQTHIDAINIPEVRDELSRGKRPVRNYLRAEPRRFGKLLQDIVGVEAIVNRVVVHNKLEVQLEWIIETFEKYEINNLIIVGGESSKISYPGPNVDQALNEISQLFNSRNGSVFCGGILIPSRSKESVKIKTKSDNGADFFTTQVLYDSSKIIKTIGHYQKLCDKAKTYPKRILISFAPVSSAKDIDFLKWLGVEIPQSTEKYLNARPGTMTNRSLDVSIEVLNDILDFIIKNKINVPIGLNVEHIMSYNFQSSIEMLQELARIYREFCIKAEFYT